MSTYGASLLHCLRCLAGLEEPESQTTAAERAAIAELSKGAHCAAEIGVFEGVTTRVIASAMAPGGMLYAVDPFIPGRLGISYGKAVTRMVLRRAGVRNRVRLVEQFSYDAAPMVTVPLDFVFIDADHAYAAVARDWADWSAKIAMGGYIALHDTQAPPHDPGVHDYGSAIFFREVIAHDRRFKRVVAVDSLNALQRVSA